MKMNTSTKILVGVMLTCVGSVSAMASTHTHYDCRSKITGNLIQVSPDFGEITKYDQHGRVTKSIDGLRVDMQFFETIPTKTLIKFSDEDGAAVATIYESAANIVLRNFIYDADKQMSCTKR